MAARHTLDVQVGVQIPAPQLASPSDTRTSVRVCRGTREEEARAAVIASRSYSEALRRLGLRPVGGNHRLFRRWVDGVWNIPTDHFSPWGTGVRKEARALEDVLVEGSTYDRAALKLRLYDSGLRRRCCELCGQGEIWHGRRMALILDHVNGVPDDNRLENLRIVCANCNATLDTHCGKQNRRRRTERNCQHCDEAFTPRTASQRYCSRYCGSRQTLLRLRRVERPPLDQLLSELAESSYSAVGRRYGVSDNAVRKWVRAYEAERRREERAV